VQNPEYCLRAKNYSESQQNQRFYKYWVDHILETSESSDRIGSVVELGCGSGFSTTSFYRYYNPDAYVGIDISEEMLAFARKNPAHAHIEFLKSKAEETPLSAEIADRVVSSFAFHWFETTSALQEISRLLRPKGRALLVIPTFSGTRVNTIGNVLLRRAFNRECRKNRVARSTNIGISLESLAPALQSSGLKVVNCQQAELVESFNSSEQLWTTLDSRGSLRAIFGKDRSDLDLPQEDLETCDFNWRVLNLTLEKI